MSDELSVTKEIDLTGLNCPLPILRTKAAFANLQSGDVLKVVASNTEYIHEIHTFSKQMGYPILEEQVDGDVLTFLVQKS